MAAANYTVFSQGCLRGVSCCLVGLLLVLCSLPVVADTRQPAKGLEQIRVWPKGSNVLPGGITTLDDEEIFAQKPTDIRNPTYIVYSPQKSTGVSIIVFPGGGYKGLAIDSESTIGLDGSAGGKWLTDSGITCVLLKYRVPDSGCHWDDKTRKNITPDVPMALQDAQRTISTIRYNAKKYNVDPNKIGVMGFSAGGNLAVLSSTAFKKRSYDPIDDIDTVSCRPDFAIPVYPGHMTMEHKNKTPKKVASKELNTDIVVSSEIPPTLLVHAKDDPVDPFYYSKVYEKALRKAGVNVKLNAYETGGHAFGVRKSGKHTDRWTDDALGWLKKMNIL